MIGLLRLIAADDGLFKLYAAEYWPIMLQQVIVLTF
jgi:hypothetical protein